VNLCKTSVDLGQRVAPEETYYVCEDLLRLNLKASKDTWINNFSHREELRIEALGSTLARQERPV
ncbi:hypothetical protein CEXT_145481, partial [Caerostris extrusa]